MRIAVTGATGHIGANLVRLLVGEGHAVVALYHRPERLPALAGVAVEQRRCDVLEPESLTPAFAGADVVIHLAALISIKGDPDGLVMRTNVEGTRNVVAACLAEGVGQLIHFSSIHALRMHDSGAAIDEDSPPADGSCFRYDHSKALGEREVLAGVERGLDATILNPTGVIGPYDFAPSPAGRMVRSLFAGRLRFLIAGGFDWVDARDVAKAALNAVRLGGRGERMILPGHWVTFLELAALCDAAAGRRVRRFAVPVGMARLGLPFAEVFDRLSGRDPLFTGESVAIIAHGGKGCSGAKAARVLGFRPRPLADTIRDTYAWFRSEGRLAR